MGTGAMNDSTSPTLMRLDDQIGWYDRKSRQAQRWFKALKIAQLVLAGLIPSLSIFDFASATRITGLLGLVILVVEGVQQLNQYQANWISYRSTCEALEHEKYLFAAGAGPYSGQEHASVVLAERIEGLISQEHAKWVSTREQAEKSGGKPGAASGA
jgi:Protein of unknown function (DUF4231)